MLSDAASAESTGFRGRDTGQSQQVAFTTILPAGSRRSPSDTSQ
jgi:hypothetical protein